MTSRRHTLCAVRLASAMALVPALPGAAEPPLVLVDRDNIEITESSRVRIAKTPIVDAGGDGVIHVTADDVTIEFVGDEPLHGAEDGALPNAFAGTGIRITATGVTLRGARVSGYKVGVHATDALGLTVAGCDLSGNFRQRLASTPKAEDTSDWLWPHANDDNEWLTSYGAALYVEDSRDVIIHDVTVRRGQNGIVLDRVNDSRVYDNDCSFLSGWGLALWRSNNNVISRNAFDFCVRGYRHGVYNRGQDSAGILLFEQCSRNLIVENSATHGGDGFFGFSGKEALGEVNPREDSTWYEGRGNTGNLLVGNDFSCAAAHGLELTFGSWNQIVGNRLIGNAICGIWGGYSRNTTIRDNEIAENGAMGYGAERGGINIEHGVSNVILGNTFRGNACGIRLWWDPDEALAALPWGKANDVRSADNMIFHNTFTDDGIAIELRRTTGTLEAASTMVGVEHDFDLDDESDAGLQRNAGGSFGLARPIVGATATAIGDTRPVGARPELSGRDRIVMTEWGPYDGSAPMLNRIETGAARHVYETLGSAEDAPIRATGHVAMRRAGADVVVEAAEAGVVTPYAIELGAGGGASRTSGVLAPLTWTVRVFAWTVDPRENAEGWRAEAAGAPAVELPGLDLRYAMDGPAKFAAWKDAAVPADRFGTLASTTAVFPPGRWRLRTTSDDGIRVRLDGEIVIDDWTWHAPKKDVYEFTVDEEREVEIRVEHFELDGYAVVTLEIEAG